MKIKFTFLISLFLTFTVYCQKDKYWYVFYADDPRNELSSSLGFKDFKGNVKIEPIYIAPLTNVKRFEKIVALTEYSSEKRRSYYLNKKGLKFGVDSLYTFDAIHDMESEGFIRFSTGKFLDSIGLFNSNGKVVIAPKYNSLSRVSNGLIIAKIGAKQKHEDKHSGCDHWTFEGGKDMIIDTLGNILIDDFKDNNITLDFHTLKISDEENKEKFRHNFKGKNNKFYSFISHKEEFEDYLRNVFLVNVQENNLDNYLLSNMSKNNKRKLLKIIKLLRENEFEIFEPMPFIDEDLISPKTHPDYFDNSNSIDIQKHPVFEVSSVNKLKRTELQLNFISTESGYKIYTFNLNQPNDDYNHTVR